MADCSPYSYLSASCQQDVSVLIVPDARTSYSEYLVGLAFAASVRGTCSKRKVGAVIAGENKRIITVNYNGPPSGQPHCTDSPCKALTQTAPASHLACRAVHAESNALLAAGPLARGGWMAVTTSPCYECAKLIVAAGIKHLVLGDVNRLFNDAQAYSGTPRDLLISSDVILYYPPSGVVP